MRKHNERCKECKKRVFELLIEIYGKDNVYQNYNLEFPNKVEEFSQNEFNPVLIEIFNKLKEYRGHLEFVRSRSLLWCCCYGVDSRISI